MMMDLICHQKWRFTSADIVFITINSNAEEEFLRERSAIDQVIDAIFEVKEMELHWIILTFQFNCIL